MDVVDVRYCLAGSSLSFEIGALEVADEELDCVRIGDKASNDELLGRRGDRFVGMFEEGAEVR